MLNRNVPEVRFSGFNEKWQCRKIESVYKKVRNAFVGTATPFYVKKGNFYLQSNNVKDGRINRVTEVFINDEFYQKQKDKWLHTGDLVMVQSGHVGHTAVIEEDLDGTAAHALIMFQGYKEPTNPYFINFQFQTKDAKRKLESVTTGNTIKHILASEMKTVELNMTCLEEQNKIAKLLYILDKMIFLNQQELTTLKQTKQGFLQKMFPKEGETVPEVRFPGFSGDWKKYKLDMVTERVRGNDGRMDLPTLTISASKGWLDQKDRFSTNIAGKEQMNYTLLTKGQLSYNKGNSKLAKYGVVFELKDLEEALVPRVYHSFKTNELAIPSFIEYLFSTKIPDRELGKIVTSGARMDGLLNIKYDDFANIEVKIPCVSEQRNIAEFLYDLDNMVALQEQELEALQQTKQAFLQKMFV